MIDLLAGLRDREYGSLDEVGETLDPVQPLRDRPVTPRPREESGDPPGAERYTDT